jgi:hypothetical protein
MNRTAALSMSATEEVLGKAGGLVAGPRYAVTARVSGSPTGEALTDRGGVVYRARYYDIQQRVIVGHRPETQTLFAQLYELVAANELALVGGFGNGLAVERKVRNRDYLYWQLRDLGGHLRQIYLGPAAEPRARELETALAAFKGRRAAILQDIERITAAYVASGGPRHLGQHFRVVDALARAGLFRAGVVLVGSHAFVSIGAALGVSWSAEDAATADIDLSRDAYVTVACAETISVDVPGILRSLDPSFFLVPELDLKAPSTSMSSRKSGLKVDLLTTARTPRDTAPRVVAPLGLAAQPLRYMDYLIRDDVRRGLFIGPYAVLVSVPDAGRFALHKLAVAERRADGSGSIKAQKDRRQAAALIQVLAEDQPGSLAAAAQAALDHHDRGLIKDIGRALPRLPAEVRQVMSGLVRGSSRRASGRSR